jgi:hypothetical protein
MVMPAVETGLQHGTLVMPSSEMGLPVLVAVSAVGRTRRGEATVAGFSRNKFTRRGGLTTVNILFKNKDDQFRSG